MKTSLRTTGILSVLAAFTLATVAVAQPPPGGPGGPFGPGPGGPGPGPRGPGPGPILDLVIPPPRPPYYGHRRHYSDVSSGSSTVARVQRALRSQGYYRGSIDGDAGPGTRGAIRSFREDHGLGSSTRIDGSLLRALGL